MPEDNESSFTHLLRSIRESWLGIIVIGMAFVAGGATTNLVLNVQKAPLVHEELAREDSTQWTAIRGILTVQNQLINNQTRVLCNMQEYQGPECDGVRPVPPLDFPVSPPR